MLLKILLTLSLIVNAILSWKWLGTSKKEYKVERVIDGDTIVVNNQQEIRLITVNAPEISMCGGQEAKAALEKLVAGRTVELKGDVNDKFGRLLALVYTDGKSVNEEMAKNGWVRYTSQKSDNREKIRLTAEDARNNKVGIYSLCVQETNKVNPKCNIKGNVKDGQKTYMYPGCGTYSSVKIELDMGDKWFCNEAEAIKEGFRKGENCKSKSL